MMATGRTLVIACGALANELLAVIRLNKLDHLEVTCLPAILHNRPEQIPAAVRRKIRANRGEFSEILCLYGDCGTGGQLDEILREEGVERIQGAHCYEFFARKPDFDALMEEELGTFFLTDYLARHFDRLIVKGLGLDRFPQLRDIYFGHYARLVYLAQTQDAALEIRARAAAAKLALPFEMRVTGYGDIPAFLARESATGAALA
jgi:Protein of unknown function (DUF1638)